MYNLEVIKLAEVESPINGKIVVLRSLGLGTYIQVEGLTQSGGVVYAVWRTALKKVKSNKKQVTSCLILGLGGGSAATLVKKFWPRAEITGVEIDPMMVDLGKRFMRLSGAAAKIVIADGYDYCQRQARARRQYDLILIDLYVGYEVPKKFQGGRFVRLIKNLLAKDGMAVFNRLYFDEKRALAMKFGKKLEKIFPKVAPIFPEANVIFICS